MKKTITASLILSAVLLTSCISAAREKYYVPLVRNSYYTPDGQYIFTINQKILEIRKTEDYKLIKIIKNSEFIHDIAFSPDNKYLALSDFENTVYVSSLYDYKLQKIFKGYGGFKITFSPNSKWLASSSFFKSRTVDESIKIWDFATGRKGVVLEKHDGSVREVIFTGNNTLISFSPLKSEIFFWDVNKKIITKKIILKHRATDIFYHKEKNVLAVSHELKTDKYSTGLLNFDLSNFKIIKKIKFPKQNRENVINSISISPDYKYFVISGTNEMLYIMNIQDGKILKKIYLNDVFQTAVFSPDGKHFIITSTGAGNNYFMNYSSTPYIYIFDAKTFKLVKKIKIKKWKE